ncbi:MAG: hypothetical protein V3V15_06910 [Sphingorhabdus sp.]
MRISDFVFLILATVAVTACGEQEADPKALENAEQAATEQAAEDGKIDCALADVTDFTRVCETERIAGPDGQILVIRHPDGGFRRFNVLTDGRGLEPAEGFDPTSITILDNGFIEVNSGGDRYRLPAKVKAKPAEPAEKPIKAPNTDPKTDKAG